MLKTPEFEVLRFALRGYEAELARINESIAEIQAALAAKTPKTFKPAVKTQKNGQMSAAGRASIAAAQKKRWALVKRAKLAKKAPKIVKPRKKPEKPSE